MRRIIPLGSFCLGLAVSFSCATIDDRGSYYRVHLRGLSALNGATQFQIYVASPLAGQWRNLRVAHDQDRIPFGVHKVSRKESCSEDGCVFYEHIALPVTRKYLETRALDAIRLDVEGPGGAIHVVPARQLYASAQRSTRNRLDDGGALLWEGQGGWCARVALMGGSRGAGEDVGVS